MIITYNGVENFKVQFSDTVLGFNPISKSSKMKQSRFGANIALVTTDHPDLNGVENLKNGDKEPFIVSGPGEYEIGGITIRGFPVESEYGGKKLSAMYKINLEGMNILFLGPASSQEIPDEIKASAFEGVNILFAPIGGDGVLNASGAYKISVEVAPNIVIPMHYEEVGEKDALKKFLKEQGSDNLKPIDKLTIKQKDLEGKEGEVVVLKS